MVYLHVTILALSIVLADASAFRRVFTAATPVGRHVATLARNSNAVPKGLGAAGLGAAGPVPQGVQRKLVGAAGLGLGAVGLWLGGAGPGASGPDDVGPGAASGAAASLHTCNTLVRAHLSAGSQADTWLYTDTENNYEAQVLKIFNSPTDFETEAQIYQQLDGCQSPFILKYHGCDQKRHALWLEYADGGDLHVYVE